MKRITILSEDFPPLHGGVAQWAKGIAQGLHSIGCNVSVQCKYVGQQGPRSEWDFPVTYLEHSHWKHLRSWYWYRALGEQIRGGDIPGFLIATKWSASRGVVGLSRRFKIPLITVVHGTEVTRPMPWPKRRWLRATLNNSAKVVSVSRFTADYLVEGLGIATEKIAVIPNGVDPDVFEGHENVDDLRSDLRIENERILLSLSRVIERKGHDMVIKSLPIILKAIPDVRYFIAGPASKSEMDRLKAIAREYGVADQVEFLGYVSSDELPRMYGLCDVYIMPSRFIEETGDCEGFGITYLEANACRKPVIGGASGGVIDAIVDGKTGYLVDPYSPEDIADKVLELLNNPEMAHEMGKNGYDRVKREYNWQTISKQIFDLLKMMDGK